MWPEDRNTHFCLYFDVLCSQDVSRWSWCVFSTRTETGRLVAFTTCNKQIYNVQLKRRSCRSNKCKKKNSFSSPKCQFAWTTLNRCSDCERDSESVQLLHTYFNSWLDGLTVDVAVDHQSGGISSNWTLISHYCFTHTHISWHLGAAITRRSGFVSK